VGLVVGLGFFISVCVIIFIVRQNPSVNLNIKIMTKTSLMALAKSNYVSIADDHIADIGIACAGNNLFNPVRP
jgi:hypothetical protein